MNNKTFIILGKSASGKDSLYKALSSQLDLQTMTTYTTRPQRTGEIDGKDYHFVNEEQFKCMESYGEFIEYEKYYTKQGEWYYGSTYEELNKTNNDKLIVLNPKGFVSYCKQLGKENIVGLMPARNNKERAISYLTRDKKSTYEEMVRRFEMDEKDFDTLEVLSSYYNYNIHEIDNTIFSLCVDKAKEIINSYK